MSVWYIDLAVGSDAAAGTSAAPFKTPNQLESAWSAGDIAYIRAPGYAAGVLDDLIDNVSVFQWPGEEQAEWRGSSEQIGLLTEFTPIGDGLYTYPGPIGLGAGKMYTLLWNYYTSVSVESHFGAGKLSASAAAVATDAAASPNEFFFFYDTASGTITLYNRGNNPNNAAIHYVARDTTIAIELTGNGNTVRGLIFKAWHDGQQGAGVWLKNGTTFSLIADCDFYDCSNHAAVISGQSVLMTNAMILNCRSFGLLGTGAHFVFYQTNGLGNISGCVMKDCRVVRHAYFAPNQSPLTACSQAAYYSHASAGTCMRGILHTGCTSYDRQVSDAAVCAVGNAPDAVTNTWAGHYNHATDCYFDNMGYYRNFDGSMAFARCFFGLQQAGIQSGSALNTYGTLGTICAARLAGGGQLYFEACPIVQDFSGGASASYIGIHAEYANSESKFVNCSIYDISEDDPSPAGQVHLATLSATATAALRFHGCVFSFKTDRTGSNEQRIFYSDGSTAVTLDNNAYGLLPNGVGHPSAGAITGATAATLSPVGCRDANPNVIGADPFTSTTNLRISPASALYGDVRLTATVVPAALIGGPRDGSYGSYAYIITAATINRAMAAYAGIDD